MMPARLDSTLQRQVGEAFRQDEPRVRRHVVVYRLVQMTCEEYGREADEHADGWRAYLFVAPRTNSRYPLNTR
jgi:hypothetical protein